jgi:hypothetical protein
MPGFNEFVDKSPDATSTSGLPKNMKWQTRAGELFQRNKVNQDALKHFKNYNVYQSVLNTVLEKKQN